MGITNLLGLARDALTAQSFGLDVTGQNIANANTPGYVKRTAMLEPRPVGTATSGGVRAAGIARSVDRFLDARAYEAGSFSASAKSRDGVLSQVESLFNDTSGSGLNDAIEALFGSFSALATNPNDPTARTATLASADNFAARVRQTSGQLMTQRQDLLSQAQATASQVTDIAGRIAQLNTKVFEAEVAGADGSDLKDQRDKLVGELADKININVFTDGGGKLVIAAAGATLVEGNNAAALAVGTSPGGAMQILVQRSNGTTFDVTAQTTAGTLGGLREARETDLVAVSQKLDQFTYDVATAVNARHAAGVGLDGLGSRALFTVAGPTGAAGSINLNAAMIGHPEYVAAASSAAELPSGSSNAIALARLADGNVATGNTRTPIEAYSDLVGDVGQRKMSSAQNVNLRNAIFSQAQSMREATSGVSMDEELISLSRYQRAYEAAAKLFRTADELLANLIREI
jgi:flagellar hook-associated protein 1 FlgK